MRYSHFIINIILCICLFSTACNRNGKVVSEEPDMTDPTQTYSIVRPDNGSGIEFISEDTGITTSGDIFTSRNAKIIARAIKPAY